ncbi:NB-ARC domain-containing protein [Nonomuraea guangzhouensis]|uniref:NB-ARC domain-containing protein n=1 Tax=Nonomuraea guangzhouensis TaxID=1291555 RepID=A0ABW4GT12_9ACTN|nr:NB-ARC domain-containing protein [Nonomuraea guangzhouensis]
MKKSTLSEWRKGGTLPDTTREDADGLTILDRLERLPDEDEVRRVLLPVLRRVRQHATSSSPAPGPARPARSASPSAFNLDHVPRLPEGFVPRAVEGQALLDRLLNVNGGSVALASTAVRGTGGFGKTTLAAWACRQDRIQAAFPDGVVWIEVGQDPDEQKLIALIRHALAQMRVDTATVDATVAAASQRLVEALADRRALIVVDDVWNRHDKELFSRGGPRCVRLITTRQGDVEQDSVRTVVIGRMSALEAMNLLRSGLPEAPNADLLPLHERCGRWPLVIALLNKVLGSSVRDHGMTVRDAVAEIAAELDRRGGLEQLIKAAGDREHDAAASIGLSIDYLRRVHPGRDPRDGAEAVRRFVMLGAFPPDTRIDIHQLTRLWDCTAIVARTQCSRFAAQSLLGSLTSDGVTLHDVIRDFLVAQYHPQLRDAHRHLVEQYRTVRGSTGWHTLTGDDARFLDDLTYHLEGAELPEELYGITADLRFLAERTRRSGPAALVTDCRRRGPDDQYGRELAELVRNEAHLLVGHARLTDLAATLYSQALARPAVAGQLHHCDATLAGLLAAAVPFPDLPDPRMRRVITGHTTGVTALAWRPDGGQLASGGIDAQILVHRPDTDEPAQELALLREAVHHLAWSPDLLTLAAATADGRLMVLDPQDGTVQAERPGNAERAWLAWAPEGGNLAIGTDHGIEVWDTTSNVTRPLASTACSTLAWSRHGLAASGPDGHLLLWDSSPEYPRTIDTSLSFVVSIAWHPHRQLIAAAGAKVAIIDPDGTKQILADSESVDAVAWTHDGAYLAGTAFGELLIWHAPQAPPDEPFTLLDRITINEVQVESIAAHPHQPLLAVGAAGVVRVWDLGKRLIQPHRVYVNAVRWSPAGNLIAAGTANGDVLFIDLPNNPMAAGSPVSEANGDHSPAHSDELRTLTFSPDGQQMLSLSHDGRVVLWDMRTRTPVGNLKVPATGPIAWRNDGAQVAVGVGEDVLLCNPENWSATKREEGDRVRSLAFDPAGKRMAMALNGSGLAIVDLSGNPPDVRWEADIGEINSIAWSPNGNRIITTGSAGVIACWETDGRLLFKKEGDTSSFQQAEFSPDGHYIVGVTAEGSAVLWEAASGHRRCRLAVDGHLTSCSFGTSSNQLVLGGANGWYLCRIFPEELHDGDSDTGVGEDPRGIKR